MMPSRPWPRIVRGRTIVTSRPLAAASWQRCSASSLARPYASSGRPGVSSVTGLCSGMPKIALDEVWTTFDDATVARREEHVGGAGDVDRPEQVAILGQRHLGDVVEHDVDAVAGVAQGAEVAHVAGHVLEPGARLAG